MILPNFGQKKLIDSINCLKCKIAIYKDAYATLNGEFAINSRVICPPLETGPDWIRKFRSGPVVYECDKAYVSGHMNSINFGHFMHDFLSPLMLMPKDFLEEGVLIIPEGCRKFGEEYLVAVGVYKYIYIEKSEWVHAQKLAVAVDPRPHNSHFGLPIQMLIDKLKDCFDIKDIVPTRYVLMNRKKSYDRYIENFDEVVKKVKEQITDINFEVLEDPKGSIADYSKIFPSIKFLFSPKGSNCIKSLFMSPGTVVTIAAADMFDYSVVSFILSLDIKLVYFTNPGSNYDCFDCDIDLTIDAIKAGVYCLKNGKWPQPEKDVSFIDYVK
ncbi:hypothetical protein TVAG_150440 [Trichomonas vaginalis G3]|uniref:Glycosyltransferase 61 catalytic domain-containing protein n=1 Tax=Trichomonas vaginalis (strain ATCC PRA-98 / G3) TaxID=412133 RepID=A2DRU6_TRIV3|nr:glycosyltransferase family [Trichomonas vaginalis G3]EAY16893.1 hypothetical protein TVAG_150440 [Trichomonas vaginalis G3]KAI5489120.1 glycosyltransferase family [Trichomonas vaginalis G3]|eukprot:XP_001329116.1 hypothetical protein [Trichomonas vaginalis G3]